MKKRKGASFNIPVFIACLLSACAVFSGCDLLVGKLDPPAALLPEGMGLLSVVLSESEDRILNSSARTMLASSPEFTRYELYVSPDPETGGGSKTYLSITGSFQLTLPNGDYMLSGAGFTGDRPAAKTWDLETRDTVTESITVNSGSQTEVSLNLSPYMDDEIYGTLRYSLSWEGGQIPSQAELLVERYNDNSTPDNFEDDLWDPIPISLIGENVTAGTERGTVILLLRSTGLVQQTGSLTLPPGEYRLTMSVTMDGPNPPVSRTDIAHIFSNLTTPAAFIYGAGDLTVTSPGTDTGSGFITRFNFTQTPNAVSIIGSNPGPDGTRLIMVMVPSGTTVTNLTPEVECASGAQVTSPAPFLDSEGKPFWPSGDYSRPTSWTAAGRNGVTQQYTVVVTEQAAGDCLITDIAFHEVVLTSAPLIDQNALSITVVAPYGTRAAYPTYALTPVFSYIGTTVLFADPDDLNNKSADTVISGPIQFAESQTAPGAQNFRVYAQNGNTKLYTVLIQEAASTEAEITGFVFDGYPDRPGLITQPSGTPLGGGGITLELPYGTSLANLKPLITYKGRLEPASGVEQNFTGPVVYTVTSDDGGTAKKYTVTVTTESANKDTGIFDFVITNVPRAKVLIGTKPRADGKIPIVVSVPYATNPLTDDGSKTDLKKLIPRITLSNSLSVFIDPNVPDPSAAASISPPDGTSDAIPFDNQNDYQEAVYRIRAQDSTVWQDYVVVAVRDVQYYYVKAAGDDTDPDLNNGGSESTPFKTLAWAVYQAVKHNVDHIYVIGTLNDSSEGGAWEDTAVTVMGTNGIFQSSGAPSVAGGPSVFNLKGAGRDNGTAWRIYITGIGSNAILQGTADKRVISVTGGAHITFDNITIQGGGGTSYGGKGGGMYIGGNSTVIWKSGGITGNTAVSGGGVYIDDSEFDVMTGIISKNTAGSSAVTRAHFENNTINADSIAGGGGVYVNGDGLFWLANGEISGNKTSGSGGGVLVNGPALPNPAQDTIPNNFMMTGGTVNSNTSSGSVWPHGGGGVYVAKGVFNMLNGKITNNSSTRQGGGVFVWSRSYFGMEGNSSVTNNSGVGSSKAICNRGITTMGGSSQADKVYIWNYASGTWGNGNGDEFTMMAGARVSGLVLAFADSPDNNRNYINIVQSNGQFFSGTTDPITTIDLESRLNANGSFSATATIATDWKGKFLVKNGGSEIPAALLKRFPLGSFTSGGPSVSVSASYKLDTLGKLADK